MINEDELIVALESRKRLIKQDAVAKSGKYAYAVLWVELLAVLRELGGDKNAGASEEEMRCEEVHIQRQNTDGL